MIYTANIWHGNSTVGTLTLKADNDQDAIAEINALVSDGYRNETGARIELSDGRGYIATNRHGEARGRIDPALG